MLHGDINNTLKEALLKIAEDNDFTILEMAMPVIMFAAVIAHLYILRTLLKPSKVPRHEWCSRNTLNSKINSGAEPLEPIILYWYRQ